MTILHLAFLALSLDSAIGALSVSHSAPEPSSSPLQRSSSPPAPPPLPLSLPAQVYRPRSQLAPGFQSWLKNSAAARSRKEAVSESPRNKILRLFKKTGEFNALLVSAEAHYTYRFHLERFKEFLEKNGYNTATNRFHLQDTEICQMNLLHTIHSWIARMNSASLLRSGIQTDHIGMFRYFEFNPVVHCKDRSIHMIYLLTSEYVGDDDVMRWLNQVQLSAPRTTESKPILNVDSTDWVIFYPWIKDWMEVKLVVRGMAKALIENANWRKEAAPQAEPSKFHSST